MIEESNVMVFECNGIVNFGIECWESVQSELNLGDTSQDVDKNTSTRNLPTIDIDRLHLAFHKKDKKAIWHG